MIRCGTPNMLTITPFYAILSVFPIKEGKPFKPSFEDFIEAFKRKYPKDYSMLQYEWEFKVHEFKKNRKGNPKTHPIRPDKILSNMYRNYYFKLIKNPSIKKSKEKEVSKIRVIAGKKGFKIKKNQNNRYDVLNKETKEIEFENLTFMELKKKFINKKVENCR